MDIKVIEKEILESNSLEDVKSKSTLLVKRIEELESQLNKTKRKLQASRDSVFPLSCEKDEFEYQNREMKDVIARIKVLLEHEIFDN